MFAESEGTGENTISGNAVYGNRNFMPFFIFNMPQYGGTNTSSYGDWNQGHIIDGSGVYITRNLAYEGTFKLINNIAFDNGINGLVVHKTTHENVTVEVRSNTIFDNGQTDPAIEGRQQAGGLTVNSGGAGTVSNVELMSNKVTTGTSDVAYQCFGSCVLSEESAWNKACGSSPSEKFEPSAFMTYDCSFSGSENDAIRAQYPPS